MHIHLGIFEPSKSTSSEGAQKRFFSDDRPRRDELDQAILSGKAPAGAAEFRHETEYNLGALLTRAGL